MRWVWLLILLPLALLLAVVAWRVVRGRGGSTRGHPGELVAARPRREVRRRRVAGVSYRPPRRSQDWYAGADRNAFIHRAWMRRGLPSDAFDGRPHIAICSTWSDLSPCNRHLQEVAEHVARGVWEAGGGPSLIPTPRPGGTPKRPA